MKYFKEDCLKEMNLCTHQHGYGDYRSLERHPKYLDIL